MLDSVYNNFSNKIVCADLYRLVNQIWKLLPMRENEEDWQKKLDSVILELRGLHELFGDKLDFLILLSKLAGLKEEENFQIYRVSIFNCITLLTSIIKGIEDD